MRNVLSLALTVLLLGGCSTLRSVTGGSDLPALRKNQPATIPVGWKQYGSKKYGFTCAVPESWDVTDLKTGDHLGGGDQKSYLPNVGGNGVGSGKGPFDGMGSMFDEMKPKNQEGFMAAGSFGQTPMAFCTVSRFSNERHESSEDIANRSAKVLGDSPMLDDKPVVKKYEFPIGVAWRVTQNLKGFSGQERFQMKDYYISDKDWVYQVSFMTFADVNAEAFPTKEMLETFRLDN